MEPAQSHGLGQNQLASVKCLRACETAYLPTYQPAPDDYQKNLL